MAFVKIEEPGVLLGVKNTSKRLIKNNSRLALPSVTPPDYRGM